MTEDERACGRALHSDGVIADFPDHLWPEVLDSLGAKADAVAALMRTRAPVHLRVNLAKRDPRAAITELASTGIITKPHVVFLSAFEVTEGARSPQNIRSVSEQRGYGDGLKRFFGTPCGSS